MPRQDSYGQDGQIDGNEQLFGLDENGNSKNFPIETLRLFFSENIAIGPQGLSILNGVVAPTNLIGRVGEFYIDTVSKLLYGPKTNSGWGTGINLVGPAGPQGPQGAQGVPGGLTPLTTEFAPGAGTSGTPYLISKDVTTFSISNPTNSFAIVPNLSTENPAPIGKQIYVINSSNLSLNLLTNNGSNSFCIGDITDLSSSVEVVSKSICRLTFLGGFVWLVESVKLENNTKLYKEAAFKLSQSGTNDPSAYNFFVDEISIGVSNSDPLYRTLYTGYVSPGVYEIGYMWLTSSASEISSSKLDLSFSSGRVAVTGETSFSLGPYTGYKFTFEVRNSSGALANDAMTFVNAYFRLFN